MVSSGPIWYMFHDNLDTAFLLTGQNNVWLQATLTVLYCPITSPCQCSGHTRVCCNQPWAVCISLTQSLGWSRHRIYAPIRCKCPTSKSKIWRKRVLIMPLVQPATALHSERRNNDRMKSGLCQRPVQLIITLPSYPASIQIFTKHVGRPAETMLIHSHKACWCSHLALLSSCLWLRLCKDRTADTNHLKIKWHTGTSVVNSDKPTMVNQSKQNLRCPQCWCELKSVK